MTYRQNKWIICIITLLLLGALGLLYFRPAYGHVLAWPFGGRNITDIDGEYGNVPTLADHKLVAAEGRSTQPSPAIQVPIGSLHVPILMYHHVANIQPEADRLRRDLTVSPASFEAELDFLSQNHYHSVTLEQVYLATQKQFELPTKPIVFTFDDGYLDVFVNAIPLLAKYNFVGSFAVVPGFFGQDGYATWELVGQAKKQGMEIISHTENHFDGTNKKFDSSYVKHNLEQSLSELDAHVGIVPRILIYPYGHYTEEYINIAKQVGFVMGLTTAYGQYVNSDTLMTTPRVRVHGNEPLDRFIEILTGLKRFSIGK